MAKRGKAGLEGVREALDGAVTFRLPKETGERPRVVDPPPGGERDGLPPGGWPPNNLGLPDGCPVEPLGVDGTVYHFLDTLGQLQSLKARDFSQNSINGLFMGRHNFLYWAWPQTNKAGTISGWQAHKVRECLMAACARKGPWSSVERIRGRGAWMDQHGRLVMHMGDRLWLNGAAVEPGEVDGFVYPTKPPLPRPYPGAIIEHEEPNPARVLLGMLRTWAWVRPEVDPILLLGWIGAAFMGGALPWRPTAFITGDKGTGKSTLQSIVKGLLGGWLVQAVDTTAAGIYQRVREDALAVSIDEMEAEQDTRAQKKVLKLARIAASGGLMLRGGDSHEGVEFKARSCFIFSSINAPPLEPQDLSRMALLRLLKLPRGAAMPVLDPELLARLGSMILRRMITQWPVFPSKWKAWCEVLSQAGHDARGQQTFGVLLACAEMIVGNDFEDVQVPFGEDLSVWCDWMAASKMHELEDATENWRGCLNHLLSVPVEAWRGGSRQTAGQVLDELSSGDATIDEAKRLLAQAGLGLRRDGAAVNWLVVPNQNPQTRRMFAGSKWGGEEGAGVWSAALRQGPRGALWQDGQCKVNGVKARATMIRVDGLYGAGGIMADG